MNTTNGLMQSKGPAPERGLFLFRLESGHSEVRESDTLIRVFGEGPLGKGNPKVQFKKVCIEECERDT